MPDSPSSAEAIPFVGASFYGELGFQLELDQRTHNPRWPALEAIQRSWLTAVVDVHPFNHPDTEEDWQQRRFRTVMEAGLTLMDPVLRGSYHDTLVGSNHAAWLKSDERRRYEADPLPDWVHVVAEVLLDQAVADRGEHDSTAAAMKATDTALLPDYIPGERLADCRRDFDVTRVIDQVLDEHAETFFHLRQWLMGHPGGLGWTWRRKHWTSQGMLAIGKARRLSARDRARAPGTDATRPHGELHLALDYWLVADDKERIRLVFHELCHFEVDGDKLKVRGHAIEAFPEEVEAFGLTDQAQAEFVAAALAHPDTAPRLEEWGVLPDDQLVLFRDYFDAAEALERAG